jgi:hypothetical protein
MNLIWSIACSRSITDKDVNSISIIDAIESIYVPRKIHSEKMNSNIVIPIKFEIVHYFISESKIKGDTCYIKMNLYDPDGKRVNKKENVEKIEIIPPKNKLRVKNLIQGISINKEGFYTFKVYKKDKPSSTFTQVSEIPIEINFENNN